MPALSVEHALDAVRRGGRERAEGGGDAARRRGRAGLRGERRRRPSWPARGGPCRPPRGAPARAAATCSTVARTATSVTATRPTKAERTAGVGRVMAADAGNDPTCGGPESERPVNRTRHGRSGRARACGATAVPRPSYRPAGRRTPTVYPPIASLRVYGAQALRRRLDARRGDGGVVLEQERPRARRPRGPSRRRFSSIVTSGSTSYAMPHSSGTWADVGTRSAG